LDIATIIGLVIGVSMIAGSMVVSGSSPLTFWDPSAMVIVLGGSLMSLLVAFPMERAGQLVPLIIRTARRPGAEDPAIMIPILVALARKARREGLLALEAEMGNVEFGFLRRGLRLVVDGADPESLRDILTSEISLMRERHKATRSMFEFLGRMSPAWGLICTLIGLVMMLGNIQKSPESLGGNMAIALMGTFYGVLLSNLVFQPMANKLHLQSEAEVLTHTLMLEGIMSIQHGENPSMVEEKLKVFLAPSFRSAVPSVSPYAEL